MASAPKEPDTAPAPAANVFRIGLTGGIATGKSAVGEVFREEGAFVLDADRLGHALMGKGSPAFLEIRQVFGEAVLAPAGDIDRAKLGEVVFVDSEARRKLNEILHPRILEEERRRVAAYAQSFPGGIAVTQAALLVEAGAATRYHRLVVTHCSRHQQLQRLRERDGISEEEALTRLEAQADPQTKISVADYAIDTSESLESTRSKAREVFRLLRQERDGQNDLG